MKPYFCLTLVFFALFLELSAQNRTQIILEGDSLRRARLDALDAANKDTTDHSSIFVWRISQRLGETTLVDRDSLIYNFHQSTLVDGQDIAMGYLGNWGSPAQTKIFFNRPETSQFIFLDPFDIYYKRPQDHLFMTTKQPYSRLHYQTGGGAQSKEERLKGIMAFNYGKRVNVGFDIDYVYSRGFYSYLSNKQLSYDFFGSYLGERYQMHAYVSNNNYVNSENGGVQDVQDIIDPTNENGTPTTINSKDIEVNMNNVWNKSRGRQLYITNRYSLGYDKVDADSSIVFVPVASAIFTSYYADQTRRFTAKDNLLDLYPFYEHRNYYEQSQSGIGTQPANDITGYWSFKNTFALALNEGFRSWVKFGLTVFLEQDIRKFSLPSAAYPTLNETHDQSSTVIGGVLSKEKGQYLKYNIKADLGVLGYNLGEFRGSADISTNIKIGKQEAVVCADGYIKNIKPTFFENNYFSKYFKWDNDFGDVRRVYLGGAIALPNTRTQLSGGVENIQNYIYYNEKAIIAQEGSNVQVVALRLDQKLRAGIFNWDNQVAYQQSSNEDVIPVPMLSLYTNVYIQTKIAKVLTLQLGADARFHTKYNAPGYEPVTLQFYNQRSADPQVGNFPFTTAYANLHLKKTRFFLMFYNVASGMANSNYFTVPNYPVNPTVFKFGLTWDFMN